MKTKLKAPRRVGSTSSAAASTLRSGCAASSAVTIAVSLVEPSSRVAVAASSAVFTRLPLWASAMLVPVSVERIVGWAFSHVEPPVVE